MLKNLHIFVSPTRLCINNLPISVTEKELGKIFKKYAPKDAVLSEVRRVEKSNIGVIISPATVIVILKE